MVREKEIKQELENLGYNVQEKYGHPPYGLSLRHNDVSQNPRGPLVCHLDVENGKIIGMYFNSITNQKEAQALTEHSLDEKGIWGVEVKNRKYKYITLKFKDPDNIENGELIKTIEKLKKYHSEKRS